jgi:hypothetical protein
MIAGGLVVLAAGILAFFHFSQNGLPQLVETKPNIDDHPTPALVAAPIPVPPSPLVTTGGSRQIWTNRFGMVFLKMPSQHFWIEMARVTPDQFNKVSGDDNQAGPEVSFPKAESFATNLTAVLQKNNEYPAGYETWRFAIPTSEEWHSAANAKSLGLKMEKQGSEWCCDVAGQRKDIFIGQYSEDRHKFVTGAPAGLPDAPPNGMALRLVLAPPPSPPK